jgi:nicotinamide riboside kinase
MEGNLKQIQNTGRSEIIKIALFGPESTGKTTLATQLADYFETAWVPEFARDYLQEKWDNTGQICDVNDMLPIAYGQTKLENEAMSGANKFLFCDTNLLVTKVFSEVYYNFCDPILDEAAREHGYDLFFLTDIDVPWEKDDLRDKPDERESLFAVFKQTLIDYNKPFITLSGDKDSRLSKAISIIKNLEKARQMGFSALDFVQIFTEGIPLENIQNQLNSYKNGIAKAVLVKPAVISDGIVQLSEADLQQKADFFDANKTNLKLIKFVPASGAASRMFQFLNEFLNDFDIENESINGYINRKKEYELPVFIVGLDKFPFYDEVHAKLKEIYPDFDHLKSDYKNFNFIKMLLSPQYFSYSNKPKAILPFHQYKTHIATPIEEHLYECDTI